MFRRFAFVSILKGPLYNTWTEREDGVCPFCSPKSLSSRTLSGTVWFFNRIAGKPLDTYGSKLETCWETRISWLLHHPICWASPTFFHKPNEVKGGYGHRNPTGLKGNNGIQALQIVRRLWNEVHDGLGPSVLMLSRPPMRKGLSSWVLRCNLNTMRLALKLP